MKFSEFNVAVNTSQIDFIVGYKGLQNFRISPSDLVGIYSSLNFISDSGSGTIDLGTQAFSILGTANEIETSGANQTLTIGLPDNVTITGELTVSGTGQSSFGGQLTIPATPVANTDAASKGYVDSQVTIQDLDFQGDSGTGAVDLDSQIFILSGTANEIETTASGQTLEIGLPNDVTIGNDLTVTSELTVSGAGQSSFSGQVTIPLTPTANTDAASKGYVDSQITAQDLDFSGDSGTGSVDLDSQVFAITGTANQIESTASGQGLSFAFPSAGIVLPNGSTATTQASSDNSTKVATTAFARSIDDSQDLDFLTDSGGGSVLINSQALTLAGTSNEIETSGTGQTITIGLPNDVTISGTYTGATFAGQLDGSISSATTATTQAPNDNSTKVATTAYVDTSAGNYLPLAGGTMSGNIAMGGNDISGGGTATFTTFVGALTGNASTASALAASGNITLTGDTTSTGGPYTYTSGGNVAIATTIADTTVTGKLLTGVNLSTSQNIAATDTILEAFGYLQAQITQLPQGLVYSGTWNANTNTPTLASGTGTTGHFYIVSVAGNTNLDGITDWQVGDWAIFIESGATDTWQKIDNTSAITGTGTANSIAKWTGPSTLGTGLISDDGTTVTIGNSGDLDVTGDTDVTGDLAWGTSLTDTTNTISITKFVDEADGIPSNDNDTSIPTSAAVKDYVDTQIDTVDTLAEVLAIGNTTGGTDISVSSGDDITFAANSKTIFNSALSIYNTGTQSVIYANTNNLLIESTTYATVQALSDIYLKPNGGNNGITITGGGAVTLYHNNASKLATTSSGIAVTGDADVSSTVLVGGADSIFAENNLRFKSSGAAYIDHNTTGQSISFRTSVSSSLDTTPLVLLGANATFAGNISVSGTTFLDGDVTVGDTSSAFIGMARAGANYLAATNASGQLVFRTGGTTAALTLDASQNATFASTVTTENIYQVYSTGASAVIGAVGNTANDINIYSTTSGHNGLRMHVNGILPTDHTGTIIDNDADLGDPNYRFKDLYLGGSISSGALTISGLLTSTLAIDQATLPDTPSEHVITLNPPTTTNYYGGGISWSEGTNTAASLGVYDAGSGGALGFYVATGNNTTLTQALTIDNSQNSTFAGTIASGNIAVTSAGNGEVSVTRTSGASILTQAQSALGRFGTTTNHNLQLMANNSGVLTISTAGNSTFSGNIQANGTFIELDSASDAQFIIDRGSTSDVARLSWRNAGSEFFRAGIETSDNDLWSLLHTCGSGLYFDGSNMHFGINTDSPTNLLDIKSNANSRGLDIHHSNGNMVAQLIHGGSGDEGQLKLYDSNSETVRISGETNVNSYINSGNLGIGSSTPDYGKLQVDTSSGNNITMRKGTGTPALAFGGTNANEAVALQEGNAGGGIKFYNGSGTLASPTWAQTFIISSDKDVYNYQSANKANTFYGYAAGDYSAAGTSNTFMGYNCANNLSTGAGNVGIGRDVYITTLTGSNNTAVGMSSLQSLTSGGNNVAVGKGAGASLTSGSVNTFVGDSAGTLATTVTSTTGIGFVALSSLTTGVDNVAIGRSAAAVLTTGGYVTAIGNYAADALQTNGVTVAIGFNALTSNTAGDNVAIGHTAGEDLTSGTLNTMLGNYAGRNATTASYGMFLGRTAGNAHTTGAEPFYIGYDAGQQVTTGDHNTVVGVSAMTYGNGSNNTYLGWQAGFGANGQNASYNTGIGKQALRNVTTGDDNTAVGYRALYVTNSGSNNTALGTRALEDLTNGAKNVAVGYLTGNEAQGANYNVWVGGEAGGSSVDPLGMTCVGYKAGYDNAGNYNVFVGYQSGYATGTGQANVGIGYRALHDMAGGDSNTATGYEAGRSLTSGVANTCVGRDAGRAITTGSRNTILGSYAGQQQTTSGDNTLIGYVAGDAITSGGANTLIGSYSGSAITTGNHNVMLGYATGDVQTTASYNTLLGNIAGTSITTGGNNTGVGHEALRFLTTGTTNTVIGLSALENGTTAYENVAVGYRALRNCSTGAGNIALGLGAGLNITTGGSNIAIGYSAMGSAAVTGGGNLALGDAAGYALTSGANNVLIGKNAGRNTSGTDSLAHVTTQSNQIHIGNKTHTDAKVNISWTVVSDKRDKTKIKELDKGLDFVENLKPVSYERRKNRETQETDNKERYGFLAQDVLELEGDSPVIVNNEDKDNLKLTSDYIIPILVNAIKELKQEIEILKSK